MKYLPYIIAGLTALIAGIIGFVVYKRKSIGGGSGTATGGGGTATGGGTTTTSTAAPVWSRAVKVKTIKTPVKKDEFGKLNGVGNGIWILADGSLGHEAIIPGAEVLLEGFNVTVKDPSNEAYVLNEVSKPLNGVHKVIGTISGSKGNIKGIVIDKQWVMPNLPAEGYAAKGTAKSSGVMPASLKPGSGVF